MTVPEPGALPAASALLSIVTALAGGIAYLTQSRRLREEHARAAAADWRAVCEAHEARITQLTDQVAVLLRRIEESEADRDVLREANLDLQRKLHRALSRIRALESNLHRARLPVPAEEE